MSVEAGKNISITCSIPSKDVQWFFSGGPLPHNAVIEDEDNLKLENVQLFNSGLYTCKSESEFEVLKDGIFVLVTGNFGNFFPNININWGRDIILIRK